MARHTAGPWEAINGAVYSGTTAICTMNMELPPREDMANAFVISASPDMLTVLKRVLNHSLIRLTGDVEIMVHDAIAKAEGRTNG